MATMYRPLAAGLVVAAVFSFAFAAPLQDPDLTVRLVPKESERRVEVLVGGELFTAYVYPEILKKPVLFPIRTARRTAITRGYPLEPRPGERVDHPHQAGLWFNYGDVNGLDFWNNSEAIPATQRNRMGTIIHRQVKAARGGQGRGELEVAMDWLAPDGSQLLREETVFVFQAAKGLRGIDRITRLTALDKPVEFKDNKEGVLGMRVARELEHPATQPDVFTDSSGKATKVPVLNNEGITGKYHSSEGKTGDDVWGTRGRWTALSGKIGSEAITIAILDHTGNPGFPTYWHARGYGLFAANTLGQKAMSDGKEELNFKLAARASAVFRYRILIQSQSFSAQSVEKEYQRFQAEGK